LLSQLDRAVAAPADMALRDRVVSTQPPHGQLHFLDRKTAYTCCRCAWTGQARAIAIMNGDWRTPVCRSCCNGLVPRVEVD